MKTFTLRQTVSNCQCCPHTVYLYTNIMCGKSADKEKAKQLIYQNARGLTDSCPMTKDVYAANLLLEDENGETVRTKVSKLAQAAYAFIFQSPVEDVVTLEEEILTLVRKSGTAVNPQYEDSFINDLIIKATE